MRSSGGKRLQLFGPALLLGQETLETEPVARKSALHQRRNQRRGAGQGLDLDPRFDAGPHQQKTGIGDAGRARIRHQRRIASGRDRLGDHLHRGVFVEFMMGIEFLLDAEMFQQERSRPRILGEYEIHVAQDIDRTQRNVVEIADRGGNDIKLCHAAMRIYVPAVPSGIWPRRNWRSTHNSRRYKSCTRRNRRNR